MAQELDDVLNVVTKAIKEAYERGRRDGVAATLDHIIRTAETITKSPPDVRVTQKTLRSAADRVPRGTVGTLVQKVLTESPGLTISEVQVRVIAQDYRVAPKSVGNEMRRFLNKRYRRRKRKWFLISHEAEKETAGAPSHAAPAVTTNSSQGEQHEATLAL